MRILIFGAGAIGSYLGGALAAKGIDTTFLLRASKVEDFQKNGLTLSDFLGQETRLDSLPYTTDLDHWGFRADVVILTVKCPEVEQAVKSLSPHLKPESSVLCL